MQERGDSQTRLGLEDGGNSQLVEPSSNLVWPNHETFLVEVLAA